MIFRRWRKTPSQEKDYRVNNSFFTFCGDFSCDFTTGVSAQILTPDRVCSAKAIEPDHSEMSGRASYFNPRRYRSLNKPGQIKKFLGWGSGGIAILPDTLKGIISIRGADHPSCPLHGETTMAPSALVKANASPSERRQKQ